MTARNSNFVTSVSHVVYVSVGLFAIRGVAPIFTNFYHVDESSWILYHFTISFKVVGGGDLLQFSTNVVRCYFGGFQFKFNRFRFGERVYFFGVILCFRDAMKR